MDDTTSYITTIRFDLVSCLVQWHREMMGGWYGKHGRENALLTVEIKHPLARKSNGAMIKYDIQWLCELVSITFSER